MKRINLILINLIILLLLILFYFYFINVDTIKKEYYGNLHTHTFASDGKMSYEEIILYSLSLGFNFIAITDHDKIDEDVKNNCTEEKRILCILGEEISTTQGHILGIGIKETINSNLTPEETINKIHEQGGLAIVAHPAMNRSDSMLLEGVKKLNFDAVECHLDYTKKNSSNYSCYLFPEFPHIYDSDAHKVSDLNLLANNCLMQKLNFSNLKQSIIKNKCSAITFN